LDNRERQHIISTVPTQGFSSVPTQRSSNPPTRVNDGDFPSHLSCPINFEHPLHAVTFDIPDSNGNLSAKVFEHSDLYQFIAASNVIGRELDVVH
jgi:hypothetical protein